MSWFTFFSVVDWEALVEPFRTLLFPSHCAGCGCRVPEHADFCGACLSKIAWIERPHCEVCSQPFHGVTPTFTCPNCRGEAFFFECAVAVSLSRSVVRDLVHRLKYGREIWLGRVLAGLMERGLGDQRLAGCAFDCLIPVPLHPRRQREREFNQAAVIAQALSKRVDIPIQEALLRRRYTTTQTALDRKGRRQNLRDAFVLRKNVSVTDQDILLVDDVLTTGSTLDACAEVLLDAGASSVRALTVARG